jgi:hypothetical protein
MSSVMQRTRPNWTVIWRQFLLHLKLSHPRYLPRKRRQNLLEKLLNLSRHQPHRMHRLYFHNLSLAQPKFSADRMERVIHPRPIQMQDCCWSHSRNHRQHRLFAVIHFSRNRHATVLLSLIGVIAIAVAVVRPTLVTGFTYPAVRTAGPVAGHRFCAGQFCAETAFFGGGFWHRLLALFADGLEHFLRLRF